MIDLFKNTLIHTNPQSDGDDKGLQKSVLLKLRYEGSHYNCKMWTNNIPRGVWS